MFRLIQTFSVDNNNYKNSKQNIVQYYYNMVLHKMLIAQPFNLFYFFFYVFKSRKIYVVR